MATIQTQLYAITKAGKYGTDEINKRIVLEAVDWDVEFRFQETTKSDDWNWQTKGAVKLKRDLCDKVGQALFAPLVRDLKKAAFEGKKETQSKILRDAFIDIHRDKEIYVMRVMAYLKIEQKDGKTIPTRSSRVELYKLPDYTALSALKKSYNYESKRFEGFKSYTPLGSFDFSPWSYGNGTWAYHDMLDIDGIVKVLTDVTFGHSYPYGKHCERVQEESGNGKGGQTSTYENQDKPSNAVTVEEIEDEFPF